MVDAPSVKAQPLLDRLLAPRIVFSTLVIILILAVLFTPNAVGDDSRGSLSSFAYDRGGSRGWYEGARRLGWRVSRRTERFRDHLDAAAVYVILSPDVEPTAAEVGALLAAVRAGAGLIVSPQRGSPLGDSLHVDRGPMEPFGYKITSGTFEPEEKASAADDDVSVAADASDSADSTGTVDSTDTADSTAIDDSESVADTGGAAEESTGTAPRRTPLPKMVSAYDQKVRFALVARRALPRDTVVFLGVTAAENFTLRRRPAVLGMPLGRGRVIAISDPWIVRNQLLDEDELVVLPQRMLEWTAPSPGARIVFDEYHHGMGRHASVIGAMERALSETPVGRAALQAMLGGLVLLIAAGARPIPPRARMRVERRSPFEHVGALARAYSQVGATRLSARRLVRGIRRRHGAGNRVEDDAAFLRRIAARHPALRPNVERLIAATQTAPPPREFTLLADDIDTIERTLTK